MALNVVVTRDGETVASHEVATPDYVSPTDAALLMTLVTGRNVDRAEISQYSKREDFPRDNQQTKPSGKTFRVWETSAFIAWIHSYERERSERENTRLRQAQQRVDKLQDRIAKLEAEREAMLREASGLIDETSAGNE